MAAPLSITSAPIDLHNGSTPRSVTVYTVPTGYMLALDSIDVVTINVTGAAIPATVTIGNTGSSTAYEPTHQQNTFAYFSSTAAEKQTAPSGTAITATITANSTATAESGVIALNGYLLANTGTTPNPPGPPSTGTVYASFYTTDQAGNPVPSVTVNWALACPPCGSGSAFNGSPEAVVSDGSGLVQIQVAIGATYSFWTALNPPVDFLIPLNATTPYELPNFTYST